MKQRKLLFLIFFLCGAFSYNLNAQGPYSSGNCISDLGHYSPINNYIMGGERANGRHLKIGKYIITGPHYFTAKNGGKIIAGRVDVPGMPDVNDDIYDGGSSPDYFGNSGGTEYRVSPTYSTQVLPNVDHGCIINGAKPISSSISNPITDPKDIGDVDFRSEDEIILIDGFWAQEGCNFHAYVMPTTSTWTEVWREEFNYSNAEAMSERWEIDEVYNKNEDGLDRRITQFELNGGEVTIKADKIGNTPTKIGWATQREPMMFEEAPYGRYDVEAKTATATGLNAAAWLMVTTPWGTQQTIKLGEEIDILEGAGTQGKSCKNFNSTAVFTYTGANSGEHNEALGGPGFDFDAPATLPGIGNDYHIYSFEWEPDEMRWLYDGYVVHRIPSIHLATEDKFHNSGKPYDVTKLVTKQYLSWIIDTHTNGNFTGSSELKIRYLSVSKKN